MIIGEIDFSKQRETIKMIAKHPYIKEWWNYILLNGKTHRMPTKQQKSNCITAIKYFLQFLSVGPKENKELTFESLVELGKNKQTRKQLESLITYYYGWLRGKKHTREGYQVKEKPTSTNTAIQYAHSKVRSFFNSREVEFSKTFKTPSIEKPAIRKTDRNTKNQLIRDKRLDYKKLDPFVLKLDFRDQLILSCLLSSGIDIGDLLDMKKEDLEKIPEFEGRYIYEGKRSKTDIEFSAIFSLRTTELLDVYLNEWRENIKDSDPVFVSNKFNGIKSYTRKKRFGKEKEGEKETVNVSQKINTTTITTRFRQVALALGYVQTGSKKQHAFRPKRFRHLFITLCKNNMVSDHAIKLMVGHKEDITETYDELTLEDLLREYKKVEPFIDIFKSPSVIEHDKDLRALKQENQILTFNIRKIEEKNSSLEERFTGLQKEVEGVVKMYEKILGEYDERRFMNFMNLEVEDVEKTLGLTKYPELKKKKEQALGLEKQTEEDNLIVEDIEKMLGLKKQKEEGS